MTFAFTTLASVRVPQYETVVTNAESQSAIPAAPPPAPWRRRLLFWMACTADFLCRVLLILWASLAVHYSNLPWPWLRTVLALLVAG
ncbi:MAG TPA: hypothetical protein VLE43_04255, partial [Candidatus Saccharimonadia bacterium]|nr:hypothetical protein [Candidatus Saccharimonadia bacterium]